MTAQPPDPSPDETPGLEPGGSVRPGDTPPESGQTSGLSHREPEPPRVLPAATLALSALAVLLVVGIFVVMIVQIW